MRSILASGWLIAMIMACSAVGGCEHHQAAAAPKGPPEVFVSTPVSKEITDYEEFSGRLEASQSILIRAHVTGYLLSHHFKEGGKVTKGQVLFLIDPQLYEAALANAQGNLLKAQGQFEQAKTDWNRVQKLRLGTEISAEEFNKFKGAFYIADGEQKAAKAQLKIAQVNMDYTKVHAPISGTISKRAIDPGNLVKADDTMLTSIGDSNPIKAYFDVDERTVVRIVQPDEPGRHPEGSHRRAGGDGSGR